jgi:DNA-binding NtrC family response regulator
MANMRACLVDDDDTILDIIEQILMEEGLTSRRFHRAEDALSSIVSEPYDIVISDLVLPGMSGMELLERLNDRGLDVPFVLITGYASLDSAIAAVNRGAFSYIKKPFNMEEIRIVIHKLRQRQDLMEEVRSLKEELEALRSRLDKGGDMPDGGLLPAQAMKPVHASSDLGRALSAIEHLGRLKNDGLITELEFGEYKGRILKRIV